METVPTAPIAAITTVAAETPAQCFAAAQPEPVSIVAPQATVEQQQIDPSPILQMQDEAAQQDFQLLDNKVSQEYLERKLNDVKSNMEADNNIER